MKYLLPALLLSATTTIAQPKHIIKAYANGSLSTFNTPFVNSYLGYRQKITPHNYLSPSVGLTFYNKKRNQHEIEWNQLHVSSSETSVQFTDQHGITYYLAGQQVNYTTIALRYEYIMAFGKKKNWIVQPCIGLGVMPYYNRMASQPFITSDYPTSLTYIGVRHFITPRININLSKNILLDINVPFCVMDINSARQRVANPVLPVAARTYSVANFDAFPKYYTARVGLGFRL